jgi:hypothetical protein
MTDRGKRAISIAIFGLGAAAGLAGCAIAPRAIFTVGANDSLPEILALLLPLTLLPASIAALWWRKFSCAWLLLTSVVWTFGMIWQRHYISVVRHFQADRWSDLLTKELVPAYFVFALAAFGLFSEYAGWPRVFSKRTSNTTEDY